MARRRRAAPAGPRAPAMHTPTTPRPTSGACPLSPSLPRPRDERQAPALRCRRLDQHERVGRLLLASSSTNGVSGSPSRPSARCRIAGESPTQSASSARSTPRSESYARCSSDRPAGASLLQAGADLLRHGPGRQHGDLGDAAVGERAQHVADDRAVGDPLQAALAGVAEPRPGRVEPWWERR